MPPAALGQKTRPLASVGLTHPRGAKPGDCHSSSPVLTSRTLDERVGARVFLKCEGFQRMGAFKFRGAYNALSRLTAEEKRGGVLTYSSGNHAQAVALAARLVGTTATIVIAWLIRRVMRI